jgi:hypothetical protein
VLRYVVIASAIVLALLLGIFALGRATAPRDAPYASKLASPGVPRVEGDGSGTAAPLVGDAPWALSALPECFRQLHAVRGAPSYVNAHLSGVAPPRRMWQRAFAGRLVAADCVVTLVGRTANVTRGDTRLVVPSDARFSIAGRRLILDRFADGSEDVRVYVLRDGKAPAFGAP